MSYAFLDPWHAFVPRDGGHVIALAGSGGKTSLLLRLAEILVADGRSLLLTTTTRSEPLDGVPSLSLAEARQTVDDLPSTVYVHAGVGDDGKWLGLEAAEVDAMGGWAPDRVVLAEVDGAAKKPLKFHRVDEPVWPQRTSLAILVMGAGAVGSPAGGAVHRLGRGLPADRGELQPHTVLTWDHLHDMLAGEGGYLAQVPSDVPVVLALAGLQEQPDSIGLFEFAGRVMEEDGVPLLLFVGAGEGGLDVRAARVCRETDDD